MRVLQILPELQVGGVERGTVDFARYLMENGHRPVVVSNGGRLVNELNDMGAIHYSLPVHKKSIFTAWHCVKQLRIIINREMIDVVHARSRVPAWIAWFACRKTRAQFVTTCHGYYSKHLFSRVMGWGKRVIAPSQVISQHMIEDFQVPGDQIPVIPRSVDLNEFTAKRTPPSGQSQFIVSIVGRITPIKGHETFLRAMARVVRRMPYVRVWIIGDAPAGKDYREELEILVKRLGMVDYVKFWGTRSDVPQLLAQTDCLVMASHIPESFGRVIIEAQAVGVPVVATRLGGALEIIEEGKTGLLVPPKDPEAMAQAVSKILGDPKFSRSLVEEARKNLEDKYTIEEMCSRTIDVYKEVVESPNILVIKMSSIGDVILISGSLRALRKKFPTAKIHCLVGADSRQILQRCPYLDGLIVLDPRSSEKGLPGLWKFSRKLRLMKFDKIVDFQNNARSHLLGFLSLAPERYGFKRGRMGFLLNRPARDVNHQLPPVEHQFQVLREMGISYRPGIGLEMWPSKTDRKKVAELLTAQWIAEKMPLAGINLSASPRWVTKNWPPEYIAKLCDLLAGENIRTVLTGTDKDKDTAREIVRQCKSKPANLTGQTSLMELSCVIERCDVYVTPDSSPLHISAAVGTPYIALFGPTDPARHIPPSKKGEVLKRNLKCSPCYSTHCRIKTHDCLKQIRPEEVADHVQRLLKVAT